MNNIHLTGRGKVRRPCDGWTVWLNIKHISMKLFASGGDRISGYKPLSRTSLLVGKAVTEHDLTHLVTRNNDSSRSNERVYSTTKLVNRAVAKNVRKKRRSETDACVFNAPICSICHSPHHFEPLSLLLVTLRLTRKERPWKLRAHRRRDSRISGGKRVRISRKRFYKLETI